MGFQDQFRNDYVTVAASSSAQSLGDNGQKGDVLMRLLIVPGTTSPGAVSITDGSGSAISVFTGGATSVADLKPFVIPLEARSTGGAWKVSTGANVTAVAIGRFT